MKRRVIIEMTHSARLQHSFESVLEEGDPKSVPTSQIPKIAGFDYDASFAAVAVPKRTVVDDDDSTLNLYDTEAGFSFDTDLEASTYLIRGEVEDKDLKKFEEEALSKRNVVGVYSDPDIQPCIICPGSPPLGSDQTVEQLLNVARFRRCKMTGRGVRVAIVDTGVNMRYLASKGKTPVFDAANSWKPSSSSVVPGSAPVGHGTMCAFDVCIAAPDCTILDIALLTTQATGGTVMEGFLSDAILAYRHLINVQINSSPRPGVNKSLVVNNSWGMFHPSWDYPVGHPGNYSDNPNHPFNRIVQVLERYGADILFAAGNCGKDCPDGRCQGVTTKTIYGANSSPYVLTVAGVDTTKKRVGYSSIGPGRLSKRKPDISGYTHFAGSGVYSADGGTSAACPVVSGVVAAVRSRMPFDPSDGSTSPSAVRNLVRTTAQDLGPVGYDFETGFGVVNGNNIASKLKCPPLINICKKYPKICQWYYFCKKYPFLCKIIKFPEIEIPHEDLIHDFGEEFGEMLPGSDDLGMEGATSDLEAKLIEQLIASTHNTKKGAESDCDCDK